MIWEFWGPKTRKILVKSPKICKILAKTKYGFGKDTNPDSGNHSAILGISEVQKHLNTSESRKIGVVLTICRALVCTYVY